VRYGQVPIFALQHSSLTQVPHVFAQIRKFVLTFAALGAIASASPALADANVGLQVMREYNLVVLGDLKSSSEVEGRTFVGGNLSGNSSNYYIKGNKAPASTAPGLTVVGSVSGGTKQLNNGSGALIGGSMSSGLNLNGGAQTVTIGGSALNINGSKGSTVKIGGAAGGNMNANGGTIQSNQGLPGFSAGLQVQATDYALGVKDLSAYLAGLTPTDQVSFPLQNRIQFAPSTTNGKNLAVFDLASTSIFNSVGEIQFLTKGFDTIIVNVGGADAKIAKNFIGNNSGLGQHVIWNFYEAQTIDFGANSFYGSVLAPYAAGKIGNFIEGSAVFGSLQQNGEIHLGGYTGNLQVLQSMVPEPATWAMMIVGFGLVGSAVRATRRRSLAAF
jgi:choice-of-anchor A domain-containing protein